MKLIVLAAGKGTRLYPLTKDTSKLLLHTGNNKTLLEKQFEIYRDSGVVSEVVYVVGHHAEQIEALLPVMSDRYSIPAKAVYNPFYETTNNLISLWLARDEFCSSVPVGIMNGDNLFHMNVFKRLDAHTEEGIALVVSVKDEYDADDMKVIRDNQGCVAAIGKYVDVRKAKAESVGLVQVRGAIALKLYRDTLEVLARDKQQSQSFWLETFNYLYEQGKAAQTLEIDGAAYWQEVDYHIDIKMAQNLLRKWIEKFDTDHDG